LIDVARDTYILGVRSLREAVRQPAFEIQNIFIPLFFFAVTVGAIGQISGGAFGVPNYTGFQMPVAILQGVAGAASMSSFGMVTDIERGYFDKLLLTPSPRLSLVLARLGADCVRVMVITLIILVVGLIFGSGMESGPLGFVLIVLLAGLFGLAYAGIGLSIALRTGSAQASQAGFLIFFPLLFLSPAFAPKEVFAPWLGWEWDKIAGALASIFGLGAVTLTMALLALRHRTA
jgi:ABC-2 type transport system permease protein